MTEKAKEIEGITIKSPSIPLFQRGKLTSPPFGKGRQGGIFKALMSYENLNLEIVSDFPPEADLLLA